MKLIYNAESCNINDKKSSCCSTSDSNKEKNLKEHWNKTYLKSPEEKLGWYETDHSPTIKLIAKTKLNKYAEILIVGAGSTTLVDKLLENDYTNLIATDLSEIALKKLETRIGKNKIKFIVDDLTKPTDLLDINPVNLWIDRAVLHFFTEEKDQNVYFELLKSKVKKNGFVLLAEFNLNCTDKCSGLLVHRYSKKMLVKKMGSTFKLIDSFEHTYIMPSGNERPYIYTLFCKCK